MSFSDMQKTGVCIITKNRTDRVRAVLAGLNLNTEMPAEVVVIHMNEAAAFFEGYRFPVRSFTFENPHPLPLGAARNYAVKMAAYENLIFLDADCIPSEKLVENYSGSLENGVLLTGNVKYLPADFIPEKDDYKTSIDHPNRKIESGQVVHELFWSLNFACTKTTFYSIGGFDETFSGYGAEDTDFAFSARKKGIPLIYAEADVYHQYHATYRPPLNHMKSIVKNAAIFYEKWHVWPMQAWLNEFEKMGFIRRRSDAVELIREPMPGEIEAVKNTNPAGF